ncbi:MAG: DUF2237 domain-containing protein [Arenimonas sp.]|uniref:DUF2237 family protein n=1 Tax=Arenimonas sp. TaxID=1872635 RepID=UPI0025C3E8E0|nr:DUF2237 domain-containing protein [Arenimonas sp.]MBW8369051.1 DUF2237 domain-containing protein [Arenimonas sp.]
MSQSALNVLGRPLLPCGTEPMTGYFRDGCCRTDASDRGLHVVCAVMTSEFLAFSLHRGNDLSTPRPEFDFPGLRPGDRWCLCANRWLEAWMEGKAPRVVLQATHLNALGVVTLDQLRQLAVDSSLP